MRKPATFIIFTVLILFTAFACGKNIREIKIGPEKAARRILIAGSASDFRNKIVKSLIDQYKTRYHIVTKGLKGIRKTDPNTYDIVVIIDEVQAWKMFNHNVRRTVARMENRNKAVILFTAGNADHKYTVKGVDVISAASKDEDPDAVVKKLSKRIDTILGQ